jgi:hypothetical protein
MQTKRQSAVDHMILVPFSEQLKIPEVHAMDFVGMIKIIPYPKTVVSRSRIRRQVDTGDSTLFYLNMPQ